MRSKVLIIYTGGTIGMVVNQDTGALQPIDFDHLKIHVPELNRIPIDIEVKSIQEPIDSSNINAEIWFELAEIVEVNYESYDGFVILHGSDTMAYTASALSFLLENVSKPIILTGSQLPIGKIRTDGKENLITAIEIAGEKEHGKAVVPEVAIYFEYALYRGNRTTKVSAENFEAFQSPNYPLLAEAGVHIKYNKFAINGISEDAFYVRKSICKEVASIKLYPSITEKVFSAVASIPNLKGLIIETFGSGNAPQQSWMNQKLKALIDQGVLVLNVSQCDTGAVMQHKYATGIHLAHTGVMSGKDITFEAAITKMMYLLACEELSDDEKRQCLTQNLRGEVSDS